MDANPYSLLFDDEPTAQEHAAALVAALRGQQQQLQQRDALASLASMGQNPLLQGFAKGQLARVAQQETDLRDQQGQLYQAGERRLQRQTEAKRFADQQALEQKMLTQRLGAEASEGAANRANQLLMERERMAAELQREQEKQNKEKGLKDLPPEELNKLAGADTGAKGVVSAWDEFAKIGGLGLLGQDVRNYDALRNSMAKPIAIGQMPMARESLSQRGDLGAEYTPNSSDSKERAALVLWKQLQMTKNALQGRITNFPSGYNPEPLLREMEQVKQSEREFLGKAGAYLPKGEVGDTVMVVPPGGSGGGSGLTPDQQKRLAELRAKRDAGTLK